MPVEITRLTNVWQDRTVFLIGGGPSVKVSELPKLRGKGVIVAINDAVVHAPFADTCFTIDTHWIKMRQFELARYRGEKLAAVPDSFDLHTPGMTYILRRPTGGWCEDMMSVCTGENSGYAALAVAILRGAKRVALLGYDMKGPGHFHSGYEWRSRYGAAKYPLWARHFTILADKARQHGVRVVNCNPQSGIRQFEFARWQDVAEQ